MLIVTRPGIQRVPHILLYVAVSKIIHVSVVSIYSDKLAHVQVVLNCRARDAPMCTSEDGLAHILGAPFIDDVMSYNSLTTILN